MAQVFFLLVGAGLALDLQTIAQGPRLVLYGVWSKDNFYILNSWEKKFFKNNICDI